MGASDTSTASTDGERVADGLRVIELGSSASVGIAGMVLADNGADVIKVEPPEGDPLRSEPAFRMWARGKQSLVADLADSAGRARVLELAGSADVALVGLKPDSVARLGLGYEALAGANARLVYGSLSGFGSRGPYRGVPAYDGLVAAKAGRAFEFSVLFDGERPAYPAAPVGTHAAAMHLLQGVFAALRERERSGRGQSFETSLVQALAVYDMVHWAPGCSMELRLEDAPFVPYTVARTADGVWLQFAQNGPALFEAFVNALGFDQDTDYQELLRAPQGKPAELRAMRAALLERIGQRTWEEWQQAFEGQRNISAEPFLLPGEALRHPQFVGIGDSRELADPEVGITQQLAPLVDFSATPARPSGPSPRLNSLDGKGWAEPPNPLTSHPVEPRRGRLLEGVTVLEFATWIATPFSCTQLADLGARVIKVEPLAGDPMRMPGPIGFKMVQGKESLALDLKHEAGREIVHRLVAKADALAHNYRPGVPERLGIDYATLEKINPNLVYLYGGSYGSTGPMSWKAAFHVTAGAVSGGARAQAGSGMPPPPDTLLSLEERARVARYLASCNEANPDFNASVAAAAALLMGLYARERRGRGQAMETRMMLSNAYMMSRDFIDYAGRPEHALADADVLGLGPLYRLYPTADGWVFLAAPLQRDFERLCEALDRSDLVRDPRFATPASRADNAAALAASLEQAFVARDADAWEAELTESGVGCLRADEGPYARFLYDAPWSRELGYVVDAEGSAYGPYRRFGRAISFKEDAGPLGGARRAGENTRPILAELGYGPDEVERLFGERVVAEPEDPDA